MWSASLWSVFNLAADVQAHTPLWNISFTHIIASSSKLLPLLQHKTRTGCYSPFLCDEEWKSPLCATSRCSRGSAGSPRTHLTCCLPAFPAPSPAGFGWRHQEGSWRVRFCLLGFWAGKETGQIILPATPSSIQAFPWRSLNTKHHRMLRGSSIMIITAKNIKPN